MPENLPRWKLKACPKCRGDMRLEYDYEYWCLMCGRIEYHEHVIDNMLVCGATPASTRHQPRSLYAKKEKKNS